MTQDAGSLQNLRDIVEPPAVSSWPWAPGWWIVVAVSVTGLAVLGYKALVAWRANAYRREALRELQVATTASDVSTILKRTALSAWPRSQVASLTGTAWCEWLQNTGPADLSASVREQLTNGLYREDRANIQSLSTFAAMWIRTHNTDETGQRT